jgi:hypothetical protein
MSNTYMRFAFYLPMRNLEEASWCNRLYNELSELYDATKRGIAKFSKKWPEAKDLATYVYNAACFSMDLSVVAGDKKKKLPLRVVIYTEESGDADCAALFVQAYLRKFRPNNDFCFSWVQYDDRASPGAFDGGAFYVTPEKLYVENLEMTERTLRASYNPGARLKPLVK